MVRNFLRKVQIATLEARLKEERLVLRIFQFVDLAIEDRPASLVDAMSLNGSRAQARVLRLFAKIFAFFNEDFDIKVVQMLECIALIHMLLLLVDDLGFPGVNDALDIVRRIVDLREFLLVLNTIFALLNLILRLHLNHLAALSNEIKTE